MKGANIVLNPINILKLNRHRELPRILIIDIASPMRRQVRATILVIRDLIFPLDSNGLARGHCGAEREGKKKERKEEK